MSNQQVRYSVKSGRGIIVGSLALAMTLTVTQAYSGDRSAVTEQTESFLGDSSSVGALVGGILAGASFANPFAPLGGTIIGFFVGKSTDFSDQDEQANANWSRPGFAPATLEAGNGMGALALSGDNSSDDNHLAMNAASEPPAAESDNASEAESEPEVSEETAPEPAHSETLAATEHESEPEPMVHEPVNLIITKQVGREQEKLDELAATIREEQNRPEFMPSERCPERDAPRYRKKLAVAGFAVEYPDQTVFGDLGQAGQQVSKTLYQQFLDSGRVLPFVQPNWQMFASLDSAPTRRGFTNELSKYSAVSREMGAQFVVSGVIRSVAVRDSSAWDTSVYSRAKRQVLGADTLRSFVVDVVVHDGYTGRVLLEKRYQTAGPWEAGRYEKVGFGSARFAETGYGQEVAALLSEIGEEVADRVACQPMLVPILEVNQQDMVLDVGTDSGLLPGDKMKVVRAQSSWADRNAPPRLIDTGVELHIHSLSLDKAQAWMPEHGGMINVQQGDFAVIY